MKLNKSFLIESILEVMMEDDELSPKSDFEKLMSALTSDLSNARQAMEMYDLGAYELSPEEDAKVKKAMMDIEAREIVTNSDNPGKDLKELGYDFHQIFMDAYGFSPPRSEEFKLWGGRGGEEILSLKATVGGKEIEFEFWYDQQFSNYIMEPWFRFETMHGYDGSVGLSSEGIINISDGPTFGDDEEVSKEQLPGALRSAMGIPWNADVPEWPELPKGQPPVDGPEGTDEPVYEGKRKLNKSFLIETILEVLNESRAFRADHEKNFLQTAYRQAVALKRVDIAEALQAAVQDLPELTREGKSLNFESVEDYRQIMESIVTILEDTKVELDAAKVDRCDSSETVEEALNDVVKRARNYKRDTESKEAMVSGYEEFWWHWGGQAIERGFEVIAAAILGGTIAGGSMMLPAAVIIGIGRVIEDVWRNNPKQAWRQESAHGKFPLLDKFHINQIFYDILEEKILDEVRKRYFENLQKLVRQNPKMLVCDIEDINVYVYRVVEEKSKGLLKVDLEHSSFMNEDRGMNREQAENILAQFLKNRDSESQIGENFGATAGAEVLQEAWDSQWPSHFSELKTVIQDLTHKQQKTPKEILAKYAIEAIPFKFLKPVAAEFNDDNWGIWGAYEHVLGEEMKVYVRDEGDIEKVEEFMSRVFNKQAKIDWTQKFFDVRRDKGNEAALRVLNKMISSLDKQIFGKPKEGEGLAGVFGALEDKGVDWKSVSDQFAKEITGVLQGMQFKEGSLTQHKIHKIIKFVNLDKSDDNAKKLEAFYNNTKAAANSDEIDVMAIANNVQIIQITNSWIEEQLYAIDMTLCPDSEVGQPCVMHQFDDGFFWYDISSDTCEITAQKMNSCGDASMSGSELFNLMSHSETGKPRWHVTVEWNEEEKAFIQVLGNANTVPKKEYWPHIKWLYENYGKPEISGYAWEHVQGNNVKQNVYDFLKYLGLKSSAPLTEEWNQMKQQINDGFYNVYSFEGDRAPEGDFSRLRFFEQAERVDMSMRIKRNLLKVGSQKGAAEWEDVRDYKNAARRLQRTEVLTDDYILDMIPHEWREFFKEKGWTQRVRFSHGGNMMLYFNWTSIPLQEMDGGRNDDPEYRNQLQREGLAFFLKEMGENFSVERMTKLGKDVGDQLAGVAKEIGKSRAAHDRGDDLDEGKKKMKLDRNYLTSVILEVLDESQYYYDAQDLDTDQAEQAIDLQQSLGGEDDRDRSEQVDKYVSLKVKKVLKDAIKTETMNAISMLVAEAADHISLWSDSNNDEEHVSKTVNELSSLYERALLRPLEAVEEFDGSQESLDKWIDAMESVEQSLIKARDPAFHYLGKISPDYFLISDHYVTGEDDDWGEHTDRKDVKPRTAVKEAEEFFRPAIMKTIMGIQSRESGVDVGEMFGLSENKTY